MDCWFEDKIQSGEEWSAGLRTGYFFFVRCPSGQIWLAPYLVDGWLKESCKFGWGLLLLWRFLFEAAVRFSLKAIWFIAGAFVLFAAEFFLFTLFAGGGFGSGCGFCRFRQVQARFFDDNLNAVFHKYLICAGDVPF